MFTDQSVNIEKSEEHPKEPWFIVSVFLLIPLLTLFICFFFIDRSPADSSSTSSSVFNKVWMVDDSNVNNSSELKSLRWGFRIDGNKKLTIFDKDKSNSGRRVMSVDDSHIVERETFTENALVCKNSEQYCLVKDLEYEGHGFNVDYFISNDGKNLTLFKNNINIYLKKK